MATYQFHFDVFTQTQRLGDRSPENFTEPFCHIVRTARHFGGRAGLLSIKPFKLNAGIESRKTAL